MRSLLVSFLTLALVSGCGQGNTLAEGPVECLEARFEYEGRIYTNLDHAAAERGAANHFFVTKRHQPVGAAVGTSKWLCPDNLTTTGPSFSLRAIEGVDPAVALLVASQRANQVFVRDGDVRRLPRLLRVQLRGQR